MPLAGKKEQGSFCYLNVTIKCFCTGHHAPWVCMESSDFSNKLRLWAKPSLFCFCSGLEKVRHKANQEQWIEVHSHDLSLHLSMHLSSVHSATVSMRYCVLCQERELCGAHQAWCLPSWCLHSIEGEMGHSITAV